MFLIVVALALLSCIEGTTVGVNVGAAWFKIATSKNGVDIALNDQSKRKSPTILSFKNNMERNIADSALQLHGRHPELSIQYLNYLLGESYDYTRAKERLNLLHSLVQIKKNNNADTIDICVTPDCTLKYTSEEIMSMILEETVRIAKTVVGKITDADTFIITVPIFFETK
jgi:molecular chaperone DnaK (HSP70)